MTNPVGRPPMFKTPEELQAKIDSYFEENKEAKEYTISGLVLHLGFENRNSMYDYERKPEFTSILKKARNRIENRIETLMLYGKQNKDFNLAGGMLWLKTHAGYTDRQVDKGDNVDIADVNVPTRQPRGEWEEQQRKKNEA
jgi:hypothetical protein